MNNNNNIMNFNNKIMNNNINIMNNNNTMENNNNNMNNKIDINNQNNMNKKRDGFILAIYSSTPMVLVPRVLWYRLERKLISDFSYKFWHKDNRGDFLSQYPYGLDGKGVDVVGYFAPLEAGKAY